LKLIESKTLATAQASIELTSIPQDGTDLVLLLSLRGARADLTDDPGFRFNGDTGNNYSYRTFVGNGAAASSGANTSASFNYLGIINGSTSTSSTFSNASLYIPNYTSGLSKSSSVDCVQENNATTGYQTLVQNLWTGTAAISSILVYSTYGTNFVAGSTISLYKITKGSDGIVTTS